LWGGITGMALTIATFALFLSSQLTGRPFLWPALLINFGLCLIVGGLVWHLSERQKVVNPGVTEAGEHEKIEIHFEPKASYETSEITNGHILSTVRIGLKASGQSFSNCKVYIEKIAPEPPLAGGLPILLEGGGFVLRPDDPEKFIDIGSQWDNANQYRFNAPFGMFAETLNYIKDDIPHAIEIKIKAIGAETIEKNALFRIWTDESKKLHLERVDASNAPARPPIAIGSPLAGLTNAQLRERTIAFATTLRHFEAEQKKLQPHAREPDTMTPQDFAKKFSEWSANEAEAWGNQYRVQGAELAEELRSRLALPTPSIGQPGFIALISHNLVGPSPISDAADYLESLARRL